MTAKIKLAFLILLIAVVDSCSKKDTVSGLATGNTENTKAVGASANDLLSAARYNTINIEIQYMPGYAPDAASINNLVNFINSVANKPSGINITQSQVPSGGKSVYSLDDVAAI
jgi:hypothetical protein